MMYEQFNPDDEKSMERMRGFFSPAAVDQSVREALETCWMMLPKEKRNVDDVEKVFHRIVDRAIENLREDDRAFGESSGD